MSGGCTHSANKRRYLAGPKYVRAGVGGQHAPGETLTFADLVKEGEAGLAIPPEKRPLPKLDFVYMRETGWNALVVYWSSRRSGTQVIGSLYRDTWVRTASGWRRIKQEKFFPDRPLIKDGSP